MEEQIKAERMACADIVRALLLKERNQDAIIALQAAHQGIMMRG